MLNEEEFAVGNITRSERLSKGLERLAEGGIDAVLLDLGLPDSQGLGTFKKVHSAAQQVPILILTAYKDDSLALEAVHGGAQDYLIKGRFDAALLVRAITYAIERKKSDEALEREAELIDLSPDAIITKTPDDAITFWSQGAEKVYGYTKAEAVGKKTTELFKTKSVQPFESIETHLRKEGKWSGELIQHTKAGRELAIRSYWLAKFGPHHEIVEIFESNVDITEQKNAERLAAIGATAGMVGHDIRNPLQTIIGEIFLAKSVLKNLPNSEEKQSLSENIEVIEEQTSYVDKIVADLQDFAKPLKPRIEETDFQAVVGQVLSHLTIPGAVIVETTIEREFPKLMVDPTYLQRILQNLATNAIQAMPKGGKLVISANRNDGKALVTVEDNGEGIPEEVRDALFQPLVTTKSKGQGFGLPVVKRMTEALGGHVAFQSEVGKGTRFMVFLPISRKE